MRCAVAILLSLVLATAACGDGDDVEPQAASTTTAPSESPAPVESEPPRICPSGPEPGVTQATVEAPDGLTREYAVDVPEQRDVPSPLVVDLYLLGGSVDLQLHLDRWGEVSDAEGVVIVYPEATSLPDGGPTIWYSSPDPDADPDGADDVGFIATLIDEMVETACIDPQRVHLIGTSLGAHMASLVACRRPDLVASVVTVANIIPSTDTCSAEREAPLLHIHGDADPISDFATTHRDVETWAAERGCEPDPSVEQVTDQVRRENFVGCSADVSFLTIVGHGHLRPGDPPDVFDEERFGTSTQDVVAADLAWEWFEQHPRTS